MRMVVTCHSEDPVIDRIYSYCQQHNIDMHCGRYILVDEGYWAWRIDCDWNRYSLWLLFNYSDYLTVIDN